MTSPSYLLLPNLPHLPTYLLHSLLPTHFPTLSSSHPIPPMAFGMTDWLAFHAYASRVWVPTLADTLNPNGSLSSAMWHPQSIGVGRASKWPSFSTTSYPIFQCTSA